MWSRARHGQHVFAAGDGAGLTWPIVADLDEAALEARLFTRPACGRPADRHLPDLSQLHQELKKPGVTLALLWQGYRAAQPQGYAHSQFCEHYRRWARALKPSMRQVHRAGEKLFVDFSGKRPHLVDPRTGEWILVELFVGVLGASDLLYAEATNMGTTWEQTPPNRGAASSRIGRARGARGEHASFCPAVGHVGQHDQL